MGNLNARLDRLESGALATEQLAVCGSCGLLHALRPTPVAMVEGIVGTLLGGRPWTVPRLCLCDCCSDQRSVAELTHDGEPT